MPSSDGTQTAPSRLPLAIFGGAFDPVHRLHLAVAEAALSQLPIEEVRWLPSGNQTAAHRPPPLADSAHRVVMLRLALANQPRFVVDTAEADATRISYTVPTLERLKNRSSAQPLVWLMGADGLHGLTSWLRWRELPQLAHIAVATRPGFALDSSRLSKEVAAWLDAAWVDDPQLLCTATAGYVFRLRLTTDAPPDLSATTLRCLLAQQPEAAARLLPHGVFDYIRRYGLYAARPTSSSAQFA